MLTFSLPSLRQPDSGSARTALRRVSRYALLAGCVPWLAACAVGPDYRPPSTPTPDEWQALPESGVRAEGPEAPSLAAWWSAFEDPILTDLVDRAISDNKSVA